MCKMQGADHSVLVAFAIVTVFTLRSAGLTIINPNGPVSFRCMDCICDTVSECSEEPVCIEGDACGMFRITPAFWMDAGMPTVEGDTPEMEDAFANCAIDKKCAVKTVQKYMEINKRDCNNDGSIDCKDFYALHILGVHCNKTLHDNFVKRFDQCDQPLKRVPATHENSNLFLPNYDENCQRCLCEAATGCNATIGCDNNQCGMYKLTRKFWEDAGSPTIVGDDPERRTAYQECALNQECAEKTLKQYLRRFGKDCNSDSVTTCTDYMLISFNGGLDCSKPVARNNFGVEVMTRFQNCLARLPVQELPNIVIEK